MFVSVYKTNISVKAVHMKEFWFKHKLGRKSAPKPKLKRKKVTVYETQVTVFE